MKVYKDSIHNRERFLKSFEASFLEIFGLVKEKRFINKLDNDLIDEKKFSMLHQILHDHYMPFKGFNCFYDD